MLGAKQRLPKWVNTILCFSLFLGLGGCAAIVSSPDITECGGTRPLANLASIPAETTSETGEHPLGEPVLRLDTGGYTAPVTRIDVDAKERYLVTGSNDNLVRVWLRADGTLLQTLRMPIGQGDENKIYAVAISPNGQIVAVGGWTGFKVGGGHNIYLFELTSGRLIYRLGGLPGVINHLAFSHDAHFLAANLGGTHGIRVYHTHNWTEMARDDTYDERSFSNHFAVDGRLVTTSYDGHVRLYNPRFKRIAKIKASGGRLPFLARFSPDGERIAVGFYDSAAVNVLSGKDLGFLYAPDTAGVNTDSLTAVAWSRDGRRLYAAGTYQDEHGRKQVRIWENGGRGLYHDIPISDNPVFDLKALSDGGLAFGSNDPVIGVLSASGTQEWATETVIADYRNIGQYFQVSDDGRVVRFAYRFGGETLTNFSVAERRFLKREAAVSLKSPRTKAPGLKMQGWINTRIPCLNGTPLLLDDYERSRSVSIAPDGKHVLLGADWWLRYFDQKGNLQWKVPISGAAWAVNIARHGEVGIAALGDGTIRWYDLAQGDELLSFFPHRDGKRWVLWNPADFFDASQGGESLIGYLLNQGRDRAATFHQLTKLYFRPELVTAYLDGDRDAIQTALSESVNVQTILAQPPPQVEILGSDEGVVKDAVHTIWVCITDRGGGIGAIKLRLNGTPISPRTPPVRRDRGSITQPIEFSACAEGKGGELFEIDVRLPVDVNARTYKVAIEAENSAGTASETSQDQRLQSVSQIVEEQFLHVLAVGIDQYRDSDLQLNYAVNDAKEISNTLRHQRSYYQLGEVRVLANEDATLDGIQQAFEDMIKTVEPNDVFVLFLSGHGLTSQGRYHFLPQDFIYESSEVLEKSSVSESRLVDWLTRIQANKLLLILDTCNAGSALRLNELIAMVKGIDEKAGIDRLMRLTGRSIIAASSAKNIALEGYKNHGVFSYSILEGLKGAAAGSDSWITVNELAGFVMERVPMLTAQKWGLEVFPMQNLYGQPFVIAERTRSNSQP